MKEWIKKNKKFLAFAVYLIITLVLMSFHENWRDEAQAWLIARDCNLLELFNEMKYEGHFLLWYLILMPFAKLGFPYVTTNIISWIITSLSVWLILDKAPFKFYKRVLLIFTFPLLYLFPIISRCYCLIPLAIVLMCISYKNKKEKPLKYLLSIVLLANTHVIMLGMVGIVLLDYIIEIFKDSKIISVKETKKRVICLIITIILLIITILPLIGCLSTNQTLLNSKETTNSFLFKACEAIVYLCELIMHIFCFYTFDITSLFIFILFLIVLFYEIEKYPIVYLKIFLCVFWQCLIYSFIYGLSLQRASTIIFILLYFKWINKYKYNKNSEDIEKRVFNIFWLVLVVYNIVTGILYVTIYEIQYNYSNAYQMGNYINENLNDNSIILSGPMEEFESSIIPYINKNIKLYHITGNRYFTYAIWNSNNRLDIELEDIERLSNIFDKDVKLYYIFCNDKIYVDDGEVARNEISIIKECIDKGIFKGLYFTDDDSVYEKNYVLYEVDLDNI